MDKRVKYSIKQKEDAVRSVLSGKKSMRGLAVELGCMRSTIRRWLAQYKEQGVVGFKARNGSYTPEFKLLVIRHYLEKGLSLTQAASYFKIPVESVVYAWLKKYERLGVEGLLKESRGRKKTTMAKKLKKQDKTSTDPAATRLAALQKENEYLRAENAFLKKLEALVQQEKATKAQARSPKPSRN